MPLVIIFLAAAGSPGEETQRIPPSTIKITAIITETIIKNLAIPWIKSSKMSSDCLSRIAYRYAARNSKFSHYQKRRRQYCRKN